MKINNSTKPMVKLLDGPIPRNRLGLNFSDKDCVAYYSIYIDGIKQGRWKSKSFHAGFYQLLNSTCYTDQAPDSEAVDSNITDVYNTSDGLTFEHSPYHSDYKWLDFPNDPDWNLFVSRYFTGKYYDAAANIRSESNPTDYYTVLPHFKNVDPLPDITNAKAYGNDSYNAHVQIGEPQIYPGQNSDSVKIHQGRVYLPTIENGTGTGQLSYGEIDVFSTNIQKEKAFFKISRTFDNESGDAIDIHDIQVEMRSNGTKGYMPLLLRDVFAAPLSVPNNSTITIEYEIGSELENNTTDTDVDGTNGGFTGQYIDSLRDMIKYRTHDVEPFEGITEPRRIPANAYYIRGIVVGSNNTYVSCTDEFDSYGEQIFQLIKPTTLAGPLLYGTTYFTGIDDDRNANEAWFDIGIIFVNQSDSDVVIKEIGLVSVQGLMARHALHQDDWITIAPGKAAQIEYRLKFTE